MGVTVTLVLSTKGGFCTHTDELGLKQSPCMVPGQWCQGKGSGRAC